MQVYRGSETRYTLDNIEYDIDYSLRVIPVRAMRSKRTTSVSSSIRDDIDEIDGESDSDSDEEEEKAPASETPISYEYVSGVPSPVIHYKLPKHSEEVQSVAKVTSTKFSGNSKSMLTKKQLIVGQTTVTDGSKVEVLEEEHIIVPESTKKPLARFFALRIGGINVSNPPNNLVTLREFDSLF